MRSITTRLSIYFLVYLCLILGLTVSFLSVIQLRTIESAGESAAATANGFMREEWERQARSLTELYAEQLVQPVYVMDLQAVRDLASVVRRQGVALSIRVLDARGRILTDGVFDSGDVGKPYDPAKRLSEDSVIVRSPIMAGTHLLGEVVAEYDPKKAEAAGESLAQRVRGVLVPTLQSNARLLAALFALAGLAGLVGAFLLSRGLARRISLVGDAVGQLSLYDYQINLPSNASDEIGQVAESLRRLALSLRDNTVSRRYMEAIIESMPVGVAVTDLSGRILVSNTCFNNLCGGAGRTGMDFCNCAGLDSSRGLALLEEVRLAGRVADSEVVLMPAGKPLDAHLLGVRVAGEAASTGDNLLFVLHDISERKDVERKLFHLATHDHLTGLANRRSILEAIGHELAMFRQGRAPAFWLVFIDLDGFKYVNDSHGHSGGDDVLRTLAARISEISRESDLVGRVGGDEFLVLLRGDIPRAKAYEIGQRFLDAARNPVMLESGQAVLSASVGMVRSAARHANADSIVAEADSAMYEAKKLGRDRLIVSVDDTGQDGEEDRL